MEQVIQVIGDNLTAIISELLVLSPMVIAVVKKLKKIMEGQKCVLRAEMLGIYYNGKDTEVIRQYEAEHFDKCYQAYKSLGGNSFIEEIYKRVRTWEIIS